MRVICDIETAGLDEDAEIFCVVCQDIDTGDVYTFEHPTADSFGEFAKGVSLWIGHNFIQFDGPRISRLLGRSPEPVLDTLVLSRLLNFSIDGGHSLEAWAERLRNS